MEGPVSCLSLFLFHDLCGFCCWYTRNLMYILDTLLYLFFSPYPVTEREADCQSQISMAQLLSLKFCLVVLRHARLVRRTWSETRGSLRSLDEESREVARILSKTFLPHKKTLGGKTFPRSRPSLLPFSSHWLRNSSRKSISNSFLLLSLVSLRCLKLQVIDTSWKLHLFKFRARILPLYFSWLRVSLFLMKSSLVPFHDFKLKTLEFGETSSRETIEVMF